MVTLSMLWLPIVVSAAVVFFAGFLAWMVLPHHKSDWSRLPNEDAFAEAVNQQRPPAGQYRFPFAASSGRVAKRRMESEGRSWAGGIPRLDAQWQPGDGQELGNLLSLLPGDFDPRGLPG